MLENPSVTWIGGFKIRIIRWRLVRPIGIDIIIIRRNYRTATWRRARRVGTTWIIIIDGVNARANRCRSWDRGSAGPRTGGTWSRTTCSARVTKTAGRTRVRATLADPCCAGCAAGGRWWGWPVLATVAGAGASTASTPVWPTTCGGSRRPWPPTPVNCRTHFLTYNNPSPAGRRHIIVYERHVAASFFSLRYP